METYFTVVLYVLTAVYGLCVGSFLNVVIYRVPLGMSLASPPSHCPGCQNRIKWYDNIPVLSYLLLGGKCRHCKEHISFRYTLVELLNTVLWVLAVWMLWQTGAANAVIAAVVCSVLVCVCFIDLEHRIIPDRFQVMLLALGALSVVLDFCGGNTGVAVSRLIGGGAGLLVFWLIAFVGEKCKGVEVLGGGDVKLCAVMGLVLGWQKLLLAVLVASLAACVAVPISKSLRNEDNEFPFAPFLTAGFTVALLFGEPIIRFYLSLFCLA